MTGIQIVKKDAKNIHVDFITSKILDDGSTSRGDSRYRWGKPQKVIFFSGMATNMGLATKKKYIFAGSLIYRLNFYFFIAVPKIAQM